jgi:beta-aspartyl-peptidase (threonine type)
MSAALAAGAAKLRAGASALDAVEAAIGVMEDDPLFNAGRGAVFTAEGKNELDASIMDGAGRRAGAVAGVTRTRHPISLARAVMEKSPHVMLIGAGADAFAAAQGLEQVDPLFFFTDRRWRQMEGELKLRNLPVPARPAGAPAPGKAEIIGDDHRFGTVGVVAMDMNGDLAAGTSTGGTTAKQWGRVGDSPIIGAGTYAQNGVCAVSATGAGEYFIRAGVAHEICALMRLKGMSAQAAADQVIHKELADLKGDGGVIVMDAKGKTAWSMNTSGMYRAAMSDRAGPVVKIFADEH